MASRSRRNMLAAEKWLLIVVDGDAALGQYWRTIVSEYIQKIVSESTSLSGPLVEQNLSGYKNKRNLVSAFGSPEPEDSESTSAPSIAMAYRKVTSSRTLTIQWPGWLQISRTMRQRIVNDSISMSQNRVDYVIFEVLMTNNTDLHDCLWSREFCAKFNLPSQTMYLTPAEHRNRFIGTILQGKQGLTALRHRQVSSSGSDKADEGPNKKMKKMQHPHT